jgi:hypothetical protein
MSFKPGDRVASNRGTGVVLSLEEARKYIPFGKANWRGILTKGTITVKLDYSDDIFTCNASDLSVLPHSDETEVQGDWNVF